MKKSDETKPAKKKYEKSTWNYNVNETISINLASMEKNVVKRENERNSKSCEFGKKTAFVCLELELQAQKEGEEEKCLQSGFSTGLL